MATKTRTYDPAKVRAALTGQIEALRSAVHGLDEEQLTRPTRLGAWRVRELVSHLGMVVTWVPAHLDDPIPDVRPITPLDWARLTRTAAATINEIAEELAGSRFSGTAAEVAAEFDRCCEELLAALPAAEEPGRLIAMRFGPMPLADFLVTRLVETVVHADDLAQALAVDFPHDKQAVAAASRLLADAFADQVPGGAVELRIPPYAVVQAVEGPRHTRGTPPNVVETDPLTWIRLATGRLPWAEAVAAAEVSASGERSDLAEYLPVLG